jgi:hypothetical protein
MAGRDVFGADRVEARQAGEVEEGIASFVCSLCYCNAGGGIIPAASRSWFFEPRSALAYSSAAS